VSLEKKLEEYDWDASDKSYSDPLLDVMSEIF
jgi:hypothetical protein